MSTLQEATEYAVLVYSSVMILALLSFIIVLLLLKHKLNKTKHSLEQKISILTNLPYIGKHVLRAVKDSLK